MTNEYVSICTDCRLSRKYKGSRIEFGADECSQSLDRMPIVKKRNFAEPVVSNTSFVYAMPNRFHLLKVDED